MSIILAKMYSHVRKDGAVVLAGRFGWAIGGSSGGMLRIIPADDYDPNDPKSAPFVAVIEDAPPKNPPKYQGPQMTATPMPSHPRAPRALLSGRDYAEGEIVER